MGDNSHRTFYDEIAAIDDACGQGQGRMREVRPNNVPSGSSHYSVNGRTMVMADEWDEMAIREAEEASLRSQENWRLARDAVSGHNAFRSQGRTREENRPQADFFGSPMQYGQEFFGGPRAVSPRSQEERNRAAAAVAAANGLDTGAHDARRRNQQEGRRMSQSGQERAIRRMRKKHSLQDDQNILSLQLMATAGYYFGTFQDQYYQQMIERATRDLGEDAPDGAIHSRATHYYDERYHPNRVRSSSSSSSSSNSRPSHSGPKALDIPEEIRERDDHPNWFICPITQELMIDPVILSSGHTYERSAITEHLRRNNHRDPITNLKLKNKTLTPNMALRHSITAHITRMANTPVQQNNTNNKKSRKKKGKGKGRPGNTKGGARNVKTRRRKKSRRKSRKRKSKKKKKKYK